METSFHMSVHYFCQKSNNFFRCRLSEKQSTFTLNIIKSHKMFACGLSGFVLWFTVDEIHYVTLSTMSDAHYFISEALLLQMVSLQASGKLSFILFIFVIFFIVF